MKSAIYEKTKAAALKVLGKDAKVPDLPPAMEKALDTWEKANTEFDASREALEAKLVEMQTANDGLKNLGNQFGAKMAKEEFGLDPKSKEDAKKIAQAQKIFHDYCSNGSKVVTTNNKALDEVDKHVIQLGKYKPDKHSL